MSTPFDKFLGDMFASMGVNLGSQPVNPTPFGGGAPGPTPRPQPAPATPPPTISPSPLPADLMAIIQQAQQRMMPQPAAMQMPPQPSMQDAIMGRAMMPQQTAGAGMPGMPLPPRPQEAGEPEGYVPVVMLNEAGKPITGEAIFVPESKAKNLPPNAQKLQDEVVHDPAAIENMRASGRLLEQQPDEVQAVFRSSEESAQVAAVRGEQQGIVPDPNAMAPGGMAVMTDEQERSVRAGTGSTGKPEAPGAIEYTPQAIAQREAASQPEVQTITVEELISSGDPDMVALGTGLQESGITSIRTDQVVMADPETGKLSVQEPDEVVFSVAQVREVDPELADMMEASGMDSIKEADLEWMYADNEGKLHIVPEADRANMESLGVAKPLTTESIRRTMPDVANQMEAQGIFEVPDGKMLIRNTSTGAFSIVDASEDESTIPDGHEYVLWGGQRELRIGEMEYEGWARNWYDPLIAPLIPMANLDKPRQWVVGTLGERAYEHATTGEYRTSNPLSTLPGAQAIYDELPLGHFEEWSRANPDKVRDAYENGWDSDGEHYTGGEAVWEAYIDEQGKTRRITSDIALDPLNYTTAIGGKLITQARRMRGLDDTISLSRRAASDVLEGTGRVLQAPDELIARPIGALWEGTGQVVGNIPGVRRLANLADPVRAGVGKGQRLLDDLITGQIPGGNLPTGQQPLSPAPVGPGGAPDPVQPAPVQPAPVQYPNAEVTTIDGQTGRIGQATLEGAEPGFQPDTIAPDLPQAGTPYSRLMSTADPERARQELPALRAQLPDDQAIDEAFVLADDLLANGEVLEARRIIDEAIPQNSAVRVEPEGPLSRGMTPERPQQRGQQALHQNDPNAPVESPVDMTPRQTATEIPTGPVEDLTPGAQLEARRAQMQADNARTGLGDPDESFEATGLADDIPASPLDPASDNRPAHWRYLTPQSEVQAQGIMPRIIDKAWDARRSHPDEWRRFAEEYDQYARINTGQDQALKDAAIAARNRGDDAARREANRQQALNDAGHIVHELIPIYNDTMGTKLGRLTADDYRIQHVAADQPKNPAQWHDSAVIENYIFGKEGTPDWRKANRALLINEGRNPDFAAMVPEIKALREAYLRQVTDTAPVQEAATAARQADAVAPQPSVLGQDEIDIPVSEVRTTRNLTNAQRRELGLPEMDLQMRDADFSEQTASAVARNFDPNQYQRILVIRGNDGNYYVGAGHSRLEGFRRANREMIPARVLTGTPEEMAEAIRLSNSNQAGLSILEDAAEIRRQIDAGKPIRQIAEDMRKANPHVKESTGAAMVRKLDRLNSIPQTSMLYREIQEGRLELNLASILGRGIGDEAITVARAESLYNRWANSEITIQQVDSMVKNAARIKANPNAVAGLLDMGDIAVDDAISILEQHMSDLVATRRAAVRTRNQYEGVEKSDGLTRTQQKTLDAARKEIEQIDTALGQIRKGEYTIPEDEVNRILADRSQTAVDRTGDTSVGDDLLRPTAPTAGPGGELPGMGRPEFGGRTSSTPGEALDADDVLAPPEKTPEQIRAEQKAAGQQDMFGMGIVRDPQREARALYDATLGRQVRNPSAGQQPDTLLRPDTGQMIEVRGRMIPEHMRLEAAQMRFEDGDTLVTRWERYANRLEFDGGIRDAKGKIVKTFDDVAELEQEAAARALNDWTVEVMREQKPKLYQKYQDELAKIKTPKTGIDSIEAMRQAKAIARATQKDSHWSLRAYDTVLAIGREMALYNARTGWRYILTQAVGNSITAILTGHWNVIADALFDGDMLRATYRELRDGKAVRVTDRPAGTVGRLADPNQSETLAQAVNGIADDMAALYHDPTDQIAAELGLGASRQDLVKLHKDQVSRVGSSGSGELRLRETADNLRLGRFRLKMGKLTGPLASRHIRDWANTMDATFRKALWGHHMQMGTAAMRGDMYEHMVRNLPNGVSQEQFDALWDELPVNFGADRIRATFSDLDAGYAERMARDWHNSVLHLDKAARDEVRRVFFSGEESNFDAFLRRTIFFHYWMSRATPLYTASLMKHPGLMNSYLKAMEEMHEQSEEYGEAVRGMLNVFRGYMGWNLFIRPDAFFQTFMQIGNQQAYSPEGQTALGRFMNLSGGFFNPVIDTVANLTGIYGDTFPADPAMMNGHLQFVQTGIDAAKSMGWLPNDGPTGNFYADWMSRLRENVSEHMPWSDGIPFSESTMYARRDINYLIQDVAEESGLDPNGIEVTAAMDDPTSDLYQEAFRRYVVGRGALELSRILPTSVVYPKLRIARHDSLNNQIAALPDGEEKDALYTQKDLAATADPRARQLKLSANTYYNLGTPEQQEAFSTYNAIRYGGLEEPVSIDGIWRNERWLSGLAPEDRERAADLWAEESGNVENIEALQEERRVYREANPDWDAYLNWSREVRNYDGGAWVYWRDLSEGNPNAERWLESQDEPVELDALERRLTGIDAYMAYMGIQASIYDPAPTSVNDPTKVPYNPADSGGSGGSGSGGDRKPKDPAVKIADDLTEYEKELQAYNDAVTAYYGQPISMQNINPMARAAYEGHLRQAGITPPSLSMDAQLYLEWVAVQPPGSDTSINAFLTWREGQ